MAYVYPAQRLSGSASAAAVLRPQATPRKRRTDSTRRWSAVRGHRLHTLAATAAATLLVVDAWFNTMTAAPGADQVSAAAMALGAELPLAGVCVVLAARGHARPNGLTASRTSDA